MERNDTPTDPSTRRQWQVLSEHVLWWLPLVVIVVLTAVAFPYYARQREAARQQSCQANLKSIALHTLRYADAHDGRLPAGPDWDAQLDGYLPNRQILRCAADSTGAVVGYGMNPALYGMAVDEIALPAETVLYHDGRDGVVVERHGGGANYAFADGHVSWLAEPPGGLVVAIEEQ